MGLTKLMLLKNMIFAGKRKIVAEGNRYKVYLPLALNEIWQEINQKGVKVEVWIRVVEG
ncbi:MAG: hypothetical protein ACXQTI_03575 [Candidatus Nezhaarchaeales archaeon]